MSNDAAANLADMRSYLDDARDARGPGLAIVDEMMLSDWCSALDRAIGEAGGSTLAAQQDAIALLRADIERLTRERDEARRGQYAANEYEATWAELVAAWRTRADALEAERDALRTAQSTALSLLGEIIRDCNNTGLPNEIVADRVIERVEGWAMEARAALGGQP